MNDSQTLTARTLLADAFATMSHGAWPLLRISIFPIVLAAFAAAAIGYGAGQAMEGRSTLAGALAALSLRDGLSSIAAILIAFALTPTATAWHRYGVFGSTEGESGRHYRWSWPEWRYFGYCMLLSVIVLGCQVGVGYGLEAAIGAPGRSAPAALGPASVMAAIAAIAVLTALLALYGLALPAAAIDRDDTIMSARDLARGNVLPIAIAVCGIWCAAAAATALLAASLIGLHMEPLELALGEFASFLIQGVAVMLTTGVLSKAYVSLCIAARN